MLNIDVKSNRKKYMAERRHAADRETGLRLDERRLSPADRFAEQCFDASLVHPIAATGDDSLYEIPELRSLE